METSIIGKKILIHKLSGYGELRTCHLTGIVSKVENNNIYVILDTPIQYGGNDKTEIFVRDDVDEYIIDDELVDSIVGTGKLFDRVVEASSMEEAYKIAIEEDLSDTICTTREFTDITSFYNASRTHSMPDFVKTLGMEQGTCMGICMKEPVLNTNTVKSTVTYPGAEADKKRVWKTIYQVRDTRSTKVLCSYAMLPDAITGARAYTEINKEDTVIEMTQVLVGSNSVVSIVEYKPSKEECNGSYAFYGYPLLSNILK